MRIFEVSGDVDNYQWIMPVVESDLLSYFSFDCTSKMDTWAIREVFVFNPKKKRGNFFALGGIGALVFDQVALDILQSQLEMAGEILPLKFGAENLYILNTLECISALDRERTSWDYYEDGVRGRILEYAFYNNRFTESSLFKIPETSKTEVLTYSGIKDSVDEFYYLYFKYGLEGLVFKEVYGM